MNKIFKQKWLIVIVCVFVVIFHSFTTIAIGNDESDTNETLQKKIDYLEYKEKYSELENRSKESELELKVLQEKIDLGWNVLSENANRTSTILVIISIILAFVGIFGLSWIYLRATKELEEMKNIHDETKKIHEKMEEKKKEIDMLLESAEKDLNELNNRWTQKLKNTDITKELSPEMKKMVKQHAELAIKKEEKDIMNWYNLGLNAREDKKYAEAEKYLKSSVELIEKEKDQKKYAWIIGSYAHLLSISDNPNKDYRKAEEYHLKALKSEPESALWNGSYASLLSRSDNPNKDYKKAEEYHLKALKSEPDNAILNSGYAKLLFVLNQNSEAEKHWQKAFDNCDEVNKKSFLLKLYFYHYAHNKDDKVRKESKTAIEKLLKENVISSGLGLANNVKKVEEDNEHPDIEQVKKFAKQIFGEK